MLQVACSRCNDKPNVIYIGLILAGASGLGIGRFAMFDPTWFGLRKCDTCSLRLCRECSKLPCRQKIDGETLVARA
jgi:hypothetical protein